MGLRGVARLVTWGEGSGQVGQVEVREWPDWSSGGEGSGQVGQVEVRGVARLVKWW